MLIPERGDWKIADLKGAQVLKTDFFWFFSHSFHLE